MLIKQSQQIIENIVFKVKHLWRGTYRHEYKCTVSNLIMLTLVKLKLFLFIVLNSVYMKYIYISF